MHHLSLMLHRLMHKVRSAISIDEPEINRLNLSIDFTKGISAQNPLILLTPKNGPTHFEYTFDFSSRLLKDNGPTLAQHCPPQMAPQCSVNSNTCFKQNQKEQSKIANNYIIYDEWRA